MPNHRNVRDLKVWEAACQLSTRVRNAAADCSAPGYSDLWRQAIRAAESVGANISEGCGRPTLADRRRFFSMAVGSLRETQHHLTRCREYDLIEERAFLQTVGLASVTRRMLESLVNRLR
jgi:four helix bundle protein